MGKRILSLVLCVFMVFGVLGVPAQANQSDELTVFDSVHDNNGQFNDASGVDGEAINHEEDASLFQSFSVPDVTVTSGSSLEVTLMSSSTVQRDIILMLDISDSMVGAPLSVMKQAATKFCTDIMSSSDDNRIGLVIWDNNYTTYDFSSDLESIKNKISTITLGAGTKTDQALRAAKNLMDSNGRPNASKNIILMTDGLPTYKAYNGSGPYTYSDYPGTNGYYEYLYPCANSAYSEAQDIMASYYLYTLGFFHSLTGNNLAFGQRFLNDIQNAGYYEVINPDDLEFIFGNIADDIVNKRTGSFYYQAKNSSGDEDYIATYFYDDNYFSQGASIYNASLATMSLCFELSAWGSNVGGTSDYTNKSRNARDLLGQIGFKNFETNDYFTTKPSEDSMGVVVAHKDIDVGGKKYTLIALATRGGGYEAEWAGNFTIGATGQHEGFKKASDEAYRFLADYITRHKAEFQTDVKFWFAGYSRGGATVNMLAGRLNDDRNIAGITFDKENLYAYCFEPPMGALKSQVQPASNYTNIHNIVNPNDPVTKVAPQSWSFARYGVDEPRIPSVLTSSNIADFTAMMEKFKLLNTEWVRESVVRDENGNEKHIVDTFQAKKFDPSVNVDLGHWEQRTGWFGIKYWVWVPNFKVDAHLIANDNKVMSAFLDELILSVATGIGGRLNYTVQLQAAARLAASEFMGGGYESYKWDKAFEIFDQKLKDHILDIAVAFLWSGTAGAEELVMEYLYDSISEAGINLYAYGSVPNALAEALRVVVRTVVASACLNGGNDLLTLFSGSGDLVDMNGKQVNGMNLFKLFPAHYPELCLAWMQMQDSNYTPEGRALFIINSYRVVRINCPVDVSVFNSSGVLVAQIINDVPQEIEGSSIVSSFNANGEKVIYLPADDQYDLNIIATGDGELNYSVSEFSYDTGTYAKIVNYYDIAISSGDVFNGVAPQFFGNDTINTGEGSGVRYSLSGDIGELTPSIEVTGDDAQNSVYAVYAESGNTEGGMVIGGGAFSEGSFAQVAAIAYEKCEFTGWYDNGILVSTEAKYRFRVESDMVLTAEFNGSRPNPTTTGTYELNIVAGSGGSITTGANGHYSDGSITPLEATPSSGYRFKNWTSSNGGVFANANEASTTFTMPANTTTLTANFEPLVATTYTITATAGTGGTVSGGGTFASGATVTLTATPNANYTFNGWYESGSRVNGAGATYSFTATANRALEARFTYSGGGGGGGGGGGIPSTSATLNIKEATFDKSDPKDIAVALSPGSYSFRDIKNDNYILVRETDYAVSGNTYTIKAAYLATLDDGKAMLTFNMSGGTNPTLSITIESGTPPVSSSDGVLLNGKETDIKLNTDDSVTLKAADISGLTAPILLTLPCKDGSNMHTGVLKKGGQDIIIPFSVYKDDSMLMLVSEQGTYGVINNKKTFTDIDGHWAANTIDFITARAIYSGVGNNKFDPNGGMTRAMFAQVLANIEGANLTTYSNSRFTDVENGAWYTAAVEWAADKGVVGGYGNNLFGPNDLITREQMAVMLNNYMKYKGILLKKDNYIPFADDDKVSSWAKEAVSDMKRYGLITGVGDNVYAPLDTANRASVAQIFRNFIEAYIK